MTVAHYFAIAVGFAVALLVYVILARRWYRVQADEIYVTRDWERDFKRILTTGFKVLLDPRESVVRGSTAPRYAFPSRDSNDDACTGYLRDAKTGSISTKPQFCAPSFIALTQEPLHMRVNALVQFRVNQDKAESIHDLGVNFGLALVGRIKQAFAEEFGKREDQKLKEELADVHEAVLATLCDLEAREPLGVQFDNVSFTFHQEKEPHRFRGRTVPGEDATSEKFAPAPHPEGVAFMEASEYDVIMNLFDSPSDQMRVLLAILEMQTRRDIAQELAHSGQLVVVTAQELGLASTAVQLEAMRKSAEAGKGLGVSAAGQ